MVSAGPALVAGVDSSTTATKVEVRELETGRIVARGSAPHPPTQPHYQLPVQLDRADFAEPAAPWLVAVFSSETCHSCADVAAKAEVMRSEDVAVDVVPFQTRRAIHQRYAIDAVPCLVIADAIGTVHASFLGPVTATDLWAAVAEARQPGSIDQGGGCDRHQHPIS